MTDTLLDLAHDAASSPWVLVALFAFAAADALIPMVPSESLVITAGVFSATDGTPELGLIIVAAAVGAFTGDHISYAVGRGAGTRLVRRARPGTRTRTAFDWAGTTIDKRGGVVLVIARYFPGARTATTLTMGALRYPLRRFSPFDALAAITWAASSTLIGYLGGQAFEDDPIKALLLGFGIALVVALGIELARHLLARSRRRADSGRASAS